MARMKKEDAFYTMLKQLVATIEDASVEYERVVAGYPETISSTPQIKVYETECDEQVKKIMEELYKAFITPFDREDIAAIAREMDEVIDNMEGVSARFELYQVTEMREDAIAMCDLTLEAVRELDLMFEAFPNFKKDKTVDEHALRVNDIEDKGDVVYSQALAKLFREDLDALEVVKWRELLSKQEHALDACKNVANAVSGVVMKNA